MKIVITFFFCIIIHFAKAQTITSAEYFIDTDPGVGNGTAITVPNAASSSFTATVPTTALPMGFHFLNIRCKDSDGRWGLFECRGFYISNAVTNVANIAAAEYFIDTDPGVGNGIAVTVPSGASSSFVVTVPTNALTEGFHFVAIRTKDANGNWGLFESRGFYISQQASNVTDMTAAEYFIDTDPGVGNAFAFTIPAAQNISQNFALNVPAGTPNGTHLLAIRTRNAAGQWSLFETDTFEVNGALPLRLLYFTGQRDNDKTVLQWKTDNEINTSHFEIEKSRDGIAFKKMSTVPSKNMPGVHSYTADDTQPYDGVNFYRLRQVDLNGSYTYSTIVKVLFNKPLTALQLYPNPATKYVQLVYSGRQKNVMIQVYDAGGRQVISTLLTNQAPLQLAVDRLPAGKYIVQLNDGEIIEAGQFVKQ